LKEHRSHNKILVFSSGFFASLLDRFEDEPFFDDEDVDVDVDEADVDELDLGDGFDFDAEDDDGSTEEDEGVEEGYDDIDGTGETDTEAVAGEELHQTLGADGEGDGDGDEVIDPSSESSSEIASSMLIIGTSVISD